jgi:hypothetical protein
MLLVWWGVQSLYSSNKLRLALHSLYFMMTLCTDNFNYVINVTELVTLSANAQYLTFENSGMTFIIDYCETNL